MPKQVIIFHYELRGENGDVIDTSADGEPMSFLEGAGQIISGLEDVLLGMPQGEKRKVEIHYQDAYGAYDQKLVARVPRDQFPTETVKKGDVFQVEQNGAIRMISVVEVEAEFVTIDANHPMAGKNLDFTVEIVSRRDATPEELAHGHAHGPHGHHH